MVDTNTFTWYSELIKPEWAPPAWLFGPVWTGLYILIFISFGKVALMVREGKLKTKQWLPFALNLVANLSFSPIQFGLRNNLLALIDVVTIWITLVWAMREIYPKVRWVTYWQIPYLLWVSFAAWLQFNITFLNWQ